MPAPSPIARKAFIGGGSGGLDPALSDFLTDGYLGEARSSSFEVTQDLKRLPDNPCRFVMLSNWNAGDDVALSYSTLSGDNLYENAGDEIYYGFAGTLAAQLFPSQSTGLLPVKNTNLISVRTRNGEVRKLFYTWFY
jgi:hypothetical protein